MTVPKTAARRPWLKPRVETLSTARAEAGLVAVNPESLGQGS